MVVSLPHLLLLQIQLVVVAVELVMVEVTELLMELVELLETEQLIVLQILL